MNDKVEINQIRKWKANNTCFIVVQPIKNISGIVMYNIRYLNDGYDTPSFASETAILEDSKEINDEQN